MTDPTEEPAVKRPSLKARQIFALFLAGHTQTDIAEQFYGDSKKQYKVSRDIKCVESYMRDCGIAEDAWKPESIKPEFVTWDNPTLDLGERLDGHTERQRDDFEDSD